MATPTRSAPSSRGLLGPGEEVHQRRAYRVLDGPAGDLETLLHGLPADREPVADAACVRPVTARSVTSHPAAVRPSRRVSRRSSTAFTSYASSSAPGATTARWCGSDVACPTACRAATNAGPCARVGSLSTGSCRSTGPMPRPTGQLVVLMRARTPPSTATGSSSRPWSSSPTARREGSTAGWPAKVLSSVIVRSAPSYGCCESRWSRVSTNGIRQVWTCHDREQVCRIAWLLGTAQVLTAAGRMAACRSRSRAGRGRGRRSPAGRLRPAPGVLAAEAASSPSEGCSSPRARRSSAGPSRPGTVPGPSCWPRAGCPGLADVLDRWPDVAGLRGGRGRGRAGHRLPRAPRRPRLAAPGRPAAGRGPLAAGAAGGAGGRRRPHERRRRSCAAPPGSAGTGRCCRRAAPTRSTGVRSR